MEFRKSKQRKGEPGGPQRHHKSGFCKSPERPLAASAEPENTTAFWRKQILVAPGIAKLPPLPRVKDVLANEKSNSIGAVVRS